MSKRKRKVKSPLGHDPFETMTDFEIEGPAPEAQETKPTPKPQIRRAFKKVDSTGEKPKAFAIADFFTTIVKSQPETKRVDTDKTAVTEIVEEEDADSFLADEAAAEAEPTVAEAMEEQQAPDEEELEPNTAVFDITEMDDEDDNDTFDFDITRISFPETINEEPFEAADEGIEVETDELPETAIWGDDTDEDEESQLEFIVDEQAEGSVLTDTDQNQPFELDDDEEARFDATPAADELPETAVLATGDEYEEQSEEDEDEVPPFDTVVLTADESIEEPQTEQFADALPETAAWASDDADIDDTVLAIDDFDMETDETEDEIEAEEEDDIFPTAAELRGILDTAELALTAEHEMALRHDYDDDEADDWGATSSLDPDLDFEWADDEEDAVDTELPNWLTNSTSSEKFDTDSLNPLLQEEEPTTAEPDLDFSWEDDESDNNDSLPEWLTAETAASKIDTDKLNPQVTNTAELEADDDLPSMQTNILGSLADEQSFSEANLADEDIWMEEDASEEPDWLAEANKRYADDNDESKEALIDTPDWLTIPEVEEDNTEWLAQDQEESDLDNFTEPQADTAQLTSSLLNNWLANTAHDADEEESWLSSSVEEQLTSQDDQADEGNIVTAAEIDEQAAALELDTANIDETDMDELTLPEWIDTEDSFAVLDEDGEDKGAFPADLFDFDELPKEKEETPTATQQPDFIGQVNTADLDEFDFDFSFYEAEEADEAITAEHNDPPEESNEEIAFDVADFAFDALESDAAAEDLNPNLDEILNRFSSLPATQVLPSTASEELEPDDDEVEEDLFDFKFDRFELASNRNSDEKELDDLVNRLATLPVTQPLQTSGDNLIDPNFADEAESNVLFSLLKEIDAEMGVEYVEEALESMAESATPAMQSNAAGQSTPFGLTKGQFVVFILGDLAYAFPLDQVEEIAQPPEIESIPNVPRWMRGVTDINNSSVPVIDLRRFFGIRSHTKESLERILVVHDAAEKARAGLLVDEVKAVRSIPNGEISPLVSAEQIAPTIRPYTYGSYNKIILLDIDRLFDSPDMTHIGLKIS